MSELPSGWASAALGDVVSKGRTNQQLIKGKLSTQPFDGSIPAYSASGQDVWCSEAGNTGPGIVLSAVGARCGKAFFADGEWTAIANTHALVPGPDVSAHFLWYLLNDEDFWVKGGTAQPFVKVKASLQREISVPPTAEQDRIVAAVEEQFSRLDAAVAALERVHQNLKRMGAAALQTALIASPRTRVVLARDLFKWSSGKRTPSPTSTHGRFPVFGGNGIIGCSNESLTADDTLVIGRVGALCGNVYLTDGPAWITDNAIYAQSHAESITLPYALLAFRAARLRDRAAGTGQPFVNQKILNNVEMPVPSIASQNAIVATHETAEEAIARMESQLHMLNQRRTRLRSSILAAAFSGKLVQQDPNDEPASVLLKRIAAERTSPNDHKPAKARSQRCKKTIA